MLLAQVQLALAMALVGANVAVGKLLAEALPIPLILCLRCILACLVLWPLARLLDGPPRLDRAAALNLALQALLGTALYNAALLTGLRLTTALEGGLVLATMPAVVALGSAAWLRERLAPRHWLAAALAAGGMAAITVARLGGEAGGSALGNALVFAGVCGEAAYVLLAKRLGGRVPVVTASFWMQLFSAAMLLPLALPGILGPGFGTPGLGALGAGTLAPLADPALAGLLVFHSLTASVLCLLLWYAGLRRVPAGVAGIFTGFLPAAAALTAVLALGEQFTVTHAVGLALMGGSLLLATWPKRYRA